MSSLCQAILRRLEAGTPLVLATIMSHQGSAPRTSGARMLILPDGSIVATIGGGRYEAEAMEAARLLFDGLDGSRERWGAGEQPGLMMEFSLAGVTDMDMVCGGALALLLEILPAGEAQCSAFAEACLAEREGRPFVFITRIRQEGAAGQEEVFFPGRRAAQSCIPVQVERRIFFPEPDGRLAAVPPGEDMSEMVLQAASQLRDALPQLIPFGTEKYLLELFPQAWRLFVFGAGHVAVDLADLTRSLDFFTTVFDDRPEFANEERFPGIGVEVPPSLRTEEVTRSLNRKSVGRCDGIVIITRGHAHDRDVLAAALDTDAGYIGMIGSRSKREGVYAALRKAGFSDADLARVHSPIGLDIGAETPREIAVSIAAELIQWRRGW